MGDVSLAKLGEIELSDGRKVIVTRLPLGGLAEIRNAIEGKDIVGVVKQAAEVASSDDEDLSVQSSIGIQIAMALPEALIAFLKWTVSEDGKVPSPDEFIATIPAKDVPVIIAEHSAGDIMDIVGAVKNMIGPVGKLLAGPD